MTQHASGNSVLYAVVFAWAAISGFAPTAVSSQTAKPETAQLRSIVVAVNKSRIISFTQPFKKVSIASTDIAEITPLSDRSLYIVGKTVGTTNISVFDQNMQLVERIDLEVTHLSNASSVRSIVITVDKSRTISFTQPFKWASIAAPDIAEITTLTDRSLDIKAKTVGATDVSVFDQNMKLIEGFDLEVTATDVSTATSTAAESPTMSAVDFLVDHGALVGREVNVGPCKINHADTLSVFCQVHNPVGIRVGTITLDPESMDRASLRRALMDCAGSRPTKPCDASSVSGVVTKGGHAPTLKRAVINWRE